MSTLKVDKVVAVIKPLPEVDGIGDLHVFNATGSQVDFVVTKWDSLSRIRVFVGNTETTDFVWLNNTTIRLSSAPAAGQTVYVYKVMGELAYKNYADIANIVADEALINSIIFG